MYYLPFRKYVFSTAYESTKYCKTVSIRKNSENIHIYFIISESSNITENSDIIIILKCVFKNFGYTNTTIIYSDDKTFCDKKKIQNENLLFVYLNETSKAKVYRNYDSEYKTSIRDVEGTLPCAFIPNGYEKLFISLNIIGKVYKYNSYDTIGKNATKYGQYITFINESGIQDSFLASSSDSSVIDLKPFVEVLLQTDTGFSYFTKKSFSIKDVLFDLIDAITILIDTPAWFKTRRQIVTMLPIHRYTTNDIKSQKAGYDIHEESL